jgi:hypothetical protein
MCWKEKIQSNGSITHGLRKEHVLRSPPSHFGQGKLIHCICKSSPMIHCGNRSFLEVRGQMFESESQMAK